MQFHIQGKGPTALLVKSNLFGGEVKDYSSTESLDLGGQPHAGVAEKNQLAACYEKLDFPWCPWKARFRHS